MNNIVLNKPILLNKKYVVFLDTDTKFSFSNKRAAQDFIVTVEKKINEAILFITEEFNKLEEFYRLYYLADTDYKFKFQISNTIEFINNRLLWMYSHTGSPNHDTILFHALNSCIEELRFAFTLMHDKAAKRKDTITKRRCSLKISIIEMYHQKFLEIGIKPKEIQLQIKKAKQ